jgi:hypothetical protein
VSFGNNGLCIGLAIVVCKDLRAHQGMSGRSVHGFPFFAIEDEIRPFQFATMSSNHTSFCSVQRMILSNSSCEANV